MRGEGHGGPKPRNTPWHWRWRSTESPASSGSAPTPTGPNGGRGLATDPAGGLVDPTTLERARAAGLDPAAMLEQNDSTAFFAALGDLVNPGPTCTNVNDCRIILVN
ncbi:MOFRL family protein [Methylobacterium oryzae CBMB20]